MREPLDEKQRSVAQIYEEIADWFDQARDKSLFERPLLDTLLQYTPKNPNILDLGCGSGEPIAQHLIEAGSSVTGIDTSPSLINKCQQRFPSQQWIVDDIRTIDLNKTFDAVMAWDCLFHLQGNDQRVALPKIAQWTTRGGIFMFSSGWEEAEFWNRFRGREEIEMFNASLSSIEYQTILENHGFDILLHRVSDPNCSGHTYWLAQKNL
ncbi:MAG: methyltransferase domain-containing protein [Cyanobacteria bacterium]|jgi:SAM-dependent methyltransferase|nr:methyltransferase domain-containing protein [Cyanobacteria bacterium GSL.Bin21]